MGNIASGTMRASSWLLLTLLALATTACAAGSGAYVWWSEYPSQAEESVDVIHVGDLISVLVKDQQQLSGDFRVRPNGTYNQPLVGTVKVDGLSVDEAARHLATLVRGVVLDPLVAVSIAERRMLQVSVMGEIRTPGLYDVPEGSGLLQLLARSGGLTDFAADDEIYVIRSQPELVRIRFNFRMLTQGEPRAIGFKLRYGDVIHVN